MKNAITNAKVEEYFYGLLPKRDAVLREMEQRAEKNDIPIVGPAVGRLLALLVKISGAKRIFEMGSAIGYSTIWLARAAGRGAEVFYSDGDAENARLATAYFRRAGVSGRIRLLVGNSLDLIRRTPQKFDLIFIDIDKHQYPVALNFALERLRRGGLLIADNTLWGGRVVRRPQRISGYVVGHLSRQRRRRLLRQTLDGVATRGIQEFNRLTYSSKELFPVLLPLRDGVTVCLKD